MRLLGDETGCGLGPLVNVRYRTHCGTFIGLTWKSIPFGKFSSNGPSSLLPFFFTTLNVGPSPCFLGGEGDSAFSYSEINWKEALGRFSPASWTLNRRSCSCSPTFSTATAAAAGLSRSSSRRSLGRAESSSTERMPCWWLGVVSGASDGGVYVECSVGSGCI